ncbi:MAG: hypothetical protein WCC38_06540 [Pseudonocardiaceae bacterium]
MTTARNEAPKSSAEAGDRDCVCQERQQGSDGHHAHQNCRAAATPEPPEHGAPPEPATNRRNTQHHPERGDLGGASAARL